MHLVSKFNQHCWSFTWSEHQYHMEGMDMPRSTPGQGRSEVTGWRNMWKASSRGIPQVELGTRMEGIAWGYLSRTAWNPPTSTKPDIEKKKKKSILLLYKGFRSLVNMIVMVTHWSPWGSGLRPPWWQSEPHRCRSLLPDHLWPHQSRNGLADYKTSWLLGLKGRPQHEL